MSSANGFLVRPAHKTEGFALFEVDVGRMRKRAEIRGHLFQFVELREQLFFGQFAGGKTPLGFVMCIDEVFHGTLSVFVLVNCASGRRFIRPAKVFRCIYTRDGKKILGSLAGLFVKFYRASVDLMT